MPFPFNLIILMHGLPRHSPQGLVSHQECVRLCARVEDGCASSGTRAGVWRSETRGDFFMNERPNRTPGNYNPHRHRCLLQLRRPAGE